MNLLEEAAMLMAELNDGELSDADRPRVQDVIDSLVAEGAKEREAKKGSTMLKLVLRIIAGLGIVAVAGVIATYYALAGTYRGDSWLLAISIVLLVIAIAVAIAAIFVE